MSLGLKSFKKYYKTHLISASKIKTDKQFPFVEGNTRLGSDLTKGTKNHPKGCSCPRAMFYSRMFSTKNFHGTQEPDKGTLLLPPLKTSEQFLQLHQFHDPVYCMPLKHLS